MGLRDLGVLGLTQSLWSSQAVGDKTPSKHQNVSHTESVLRERRLREHGEP